MATVTLPGSGKAFVSITTGADDRAALAAAIKTEFNKAGSNFTADTVPSGAAGKAGFFNLVFEDSNKTVSAKAGKNVEAIIDIGKGKDILTGGAQTDLIVGSNGGNLISTDLASGVASVFGGKGNDTLNVSGKAEAYLEGGKNVVNLNGGDSISLLGTGGSDTVNITAGNNTVATALAATVNISAKKAFETLTLATASKVSISGSSDTVTLTSNKASVNLLGSGEKISLSGLDTVNITAGTKDTVISTGPLSVKITATKSNDTLSFGGKSTISLGSSDTVTLTGKGAAIVTATGSATVIGGAGVLKFTGAAGAKDSITAGSGAATITAGFGAHDKLVAGSGTALLTHGKGGSDTMVAGSGNSTMVGAGTDKTHTDLFVFHKGTGGNHTIQAFTSGKDTIDLVGYTKAQIDAAITAGAKTFNAKHGTETITLADHTKITISGLHHALTKGNFTGS